ncbi:MAG: hypothetical protein U9N12_05750, partial [Euryarchaeota archaeon]|nr:hypothetical protein [Euryarchaeota archaeon]
RNQHPEQTCTRGLRGINACGAGCMSNHNEAGSPVTCSGEEVTIEDTRFDEISTKSRNHGFVL